MDIKQLSSKTPSELQADLEKLRKKSFDLGMELVQGKLKDTTARLKLRRDVARIKTVLRRKEILAELNLKERSK